MAERERKGKREVSKKASAAAEVGFGERQLAREIVCFIPIVRPRIPCQRNNVVGGCVIKKNTTLVTFYHVFCPRAYKIKSEGEGKLEAVRLKHRWWKEITNLLWPQKVQSWPIPTPPSMPPRSIWCPFGNLLPITVGFPLCAHSLVREQLTSSLKW